MNTQREMPKYKCHKEVWALKIKSVLTERRIDWDMTLSFEGGYSSVKVSKEYREKHSPEAGGYYVVYKDGYKSYSPADVFDGGYSLIGGSHDTGLADSVEKRPT
jgi:hypothetical protein